MDRKATTEDAAGARSKRAFRSKGDPSMNDLDGRRALVTGANRGIGAATALALARRGAPVFAADREPPEQEGKGG